MADEQDERSEAKEGRQWSRQVHLTFRPKDARLIEIAAYLSKKTATRWLRDLAVAAAREETEIDPYSPRPLS